MNPLFLTDGYKTGHDRQYPPGTTRVYSNFTPRTNKYAPAGCDLLVSFGQQMITRQIHDAFANEFFSKPKDEVCGEMKRELSMYLNTDYDVSHFERLHDLGYLPICIKSLEEGTLVPMKVPVLTIYNTHPDFFWVTNYLETIISNLLWKPMTSATIAHTYRKLLTSWQEKTDAEKSWFVDWQGHDFSMRGMDSIDAVISSGLGHLTSFSGSDSLPTIYGARKYYNAEGPICGSVNATEHSVMCAGSKESEIETFKRLMVTYPEAILSVVSDTWDLTRVVKPGERGICYDLKDMIMARDGKLVIRPDSGDPVDIICGHGDTELTDREKESFYPEFYTKGLIECLWEIFGGTINEQGYKCLDSHIGGIYGDSITIARADEICKRLEAKGFSSTNIVLGIGSFTYQFNTRDTFGFAMKATYVEVDGEGREIFKDPMTDDGTKKSATGLLAIYKDPIDGEYKLVDKCNWATEEAGELKCIYLNGQFENQITFNEIRENLKRAK